MEKIDTNLIKEILHKNDIEFAGLFGSRARGEETDESDLDVLIRFKPDSNKSLLDLIRIQNEIADTLGIKVDLVTEASISPHIRDYIMRDLKLIYGKR